MSMEEADFIVFLRGIAPRLKSIAVKLNRGFSSLDDRDLFQEAVIFLWEHFRKGDFADKTESYVLQGCYFHMQNSIRLSKDRIKRVCIDAPREDGCGPDELCFLAGPAPDEFIEILDSRLLAEVICNNGLTAREKSFLPLFAQGLTTREIGGKMGVSHVRVIKIKKIIGEKCRKYLDLDIA